MKAHSLEFLRVYFPILTGFPPYPWQEQAFVELIENRLARTIAAPTGSGKTSLIAVWIIAFAWSRLHATAVRIPRRLIWVVNNRVVVDQATEVAEATRNAVRQMPDTDPLRRALADAALSTEGPLIAISTLRGQFADNEEWRRDPSRPAIVVGTVDMIGSNLLFRGYREGRYWRPTNAGLLGVDALIVNDEAHLTPAFRQLLVRIESCQPARAVPGYKRFQVHLLSATSDPDPGGCFQHDFQEDVQGSGQFAKVLNATKRLRLAMIGDQDYESAAHAMATSDPAPRTIVFVERPESALKFVHRLERTVEARRVGLLTGTMRGYERDQLVAGETFAAFRAPETPSHGPLFLVGTAACEVGIDITCERMITSLVTAERLHQRFGRLNRFGSADNGEAIVLAQRQQEREHIETLAWLRSLPEGDISTAALSTRPAPIAARTPPPLVARLEPWRVEMWALTTQRDHVRLSGCKPVLSMAPVGPWLHGKDKTEDAPETEVTWRDDVPYLAQADEAHIEEVLGKYRVLARERLREPTSRVMEKLHRLELAVGLDPSIPLLLVEADGKVDVIALDRLKQEIAIDRASAAGLLANRVLILPVGVGRPDRGMFSPEQPTETAMRTIDVAEMEGTSERARYLMAEVVKPLGRSPVLKSNSDASIDNSRLANYAAENGYGKPLIIPLTGDDEQEVARHLVYFPSAPATPRRPTIEIALQPHLARVAQFAVDLAERLDLGPMSDDFREAGHLHDLGKDSGVWRKAMGVKPGMPALAKAAGQGSSRALGGYRHEFRVLLKSDPAREVANHVGATHHGFGRPFFETRHYDPEALRQDCLTAADLHTRVGSADCSGGSAHGGSPT